MTRFAGGALTVFMLVACECLQGDSLYFESKTESVDTGRRSAELAEAKPGTSTSMEAVFLTQSIMAANPTNSSSMHTGYTTGAIIGIVLGVSHVVVGIVIIVKLIIITLRRRKRAMSGPGTAQLDVQQVDGQQKQASNKRHPETVKNLELPSSVIHGDTIVPDSAHNRELSKNHGEQVDRQWYRTTIESLSLQFNELARRFHNITGQKHKVPPTYGNEV
jgi:hypothetical protein